MISKVILTLFLIASILKGGDIVPENGDFMVEERENLDFIYAKEYSNYKETIIERLKSIEKCNNSSYGFNLKHFYSVVPSINDQINNGYATMIPFNKMVLYNGGNSIVDYFSSLSWIDALLYHEMAHLYQLSAQDPTSEMISSIFGNSLFSPLLLPFLFPNATLPDFILEGNSILNESTVGNGGRLYSGEHRAIFYAVFPKIDKSRLFNNHLQFPFLSEKYIVGSFFTLFLANREGIDRVNRFFKHHSQHYLNPFLINSSFMNYFGDSFDSLFEDFIRYYSEESRSFREEDGTPILKSRIEYPLSKGESGLYIFAEDEFRDPMLYKVSSDGNLTPIERREAGQIFEINGNLLYRKSAYVEPNSIQYGLWGGEQELLEWSKSRLYYDNYSDGNRTSWLYFDVKSSMVQPHLYRDGEFIDKVNSIPMFGESGEVLYFKSSENIRSLYRNGEKLTEFKGYYSKVVGSNSRGEVLFLASTEYGSSLYRFSSEKGVERVLHGDNIISARILSDDKVLLQTVVGDGYSYIIKEIGDGWSETPFYEELPKQTIQKVEVDEVKAKPYNQLSDIKFSNLSFMAGSEYSNIILSFTDPVGWNSLSTKYENLSGDDDREHRGQISYSSNRAFDLLLSTTFSEDEILGRVGISYPLYKRGYISKNIGAEVSTSADLTSSTLYYSKIYNKHYGYSLFTNQANNYRFSYRADSNSSHIVNGIYRLREDFSHEFYLDFGADLSVDVSGNSGVLITGNGIDSSNDMTSLYIDGFTQFGREINSDSLLSLSFGVSKVFNGSLYSYRVPLSIRREAISLHHTSTVFEREFGERVRDIQNTTLRLTFELLFGHKVALPFSLSFHKNSRTGSSSTIGLSGVF